jgi:hypothetical protein
MCVRRHDDTQKQKKRCDLQKKKGRRKEGNEMGEIEKKKGGERNDKE